MTHFPIPTTTPRTKELSGDLPYFVSSPHVQKTFSESPTFNSALFQNNASSEVQSDRIWERRVILGDKVVRNTPVFQHWVLNILRKFIEYMALPIVVCFKGHPRLSPQNAMIWEPNFIGVRPENWIYGIKKWEGKHVASDVIRGSLWPT